MEEAYVVLCMVEQEDSTAVKTLYSFPYATKAAAEEALMWFTTQPGVYCKFVVDVERGMEE